MLAIKSKAENNTLAFMYNNDDAFGFTYNGTEYFYVKNAQNDVVAITDANGTIIAHYTYDDWGKVTSVTDADGVEIKDESHIANINPLRYLSYYLDAEIGFYFLRTRYYVPNICRFLNVDVVDILYEEQDSIIEHNLFVYCLNNPLNMEDENGNIARAKRFSAVASTFVILGAIVSPKITLAVLCVVAVPIASYYTYKGIKRVVRFAKAKGKERQRDSGLSDVSDAEIERRLKDPNTPASEKQRLKREQKARETRNQSKRSGYHRRKK